MTRYFCTLCKEYRHGEKLFVNPDKTLTVHLSCGHQETVASTKSQKVVQ